MSRVIIERETSRSFLSGQIEIFVDGKSYGKLPSNKRADIFVLQGDHIVAVRMGRKLGTSLHLRAVEREIITIRCRDEGGLGTRVHLEEVCRTHSKDRF